jgi:hypothetical protein
MQIPKSRSNRALLSTLLLALAFAVASALSPPDSSAATAKAKQKTFASPEEAVKAMIDAMKAGDNAQLSSIFGPGAENVISSGDNVVNQGERERFLKNYEEKNSLERRGEDEVILQVGKDDWPLPIPIRKTGSAWYFDTNAGKEELLNRRIGRNELNIIDILEIYVAAQREYAAKDRDGDGVYPYAQKIRSTPGKKDGLYWKAGEGEEQSPLGPLAAEAAREGYSKKPGSGKPVPFHGYLFRTLSAQGKNAPGGRYSYLVKGKMLLGFAMVAYPANYGVSGVMTFLVNQEGVVYQKDLGRNTARKAVAMKEYDPDPTWRKVEAGPPEGSAQGK